MSRSTASTSPRGWQPLSRRILRPLLALALLLAAGLPGYNAYARWQLAREAERGPRDPRSGVLVGAEAITLEGQGGSAVLLVHGFAGSRQDFGELGPRLRARGHTVRLTRLPGHGTRPERFAEVEAEAMLDHLRQERARLARRHARVDLVGFSMGGALVTLLAAELAESEGASAGRLVLVAPYFDVTDQWYYGLEPQTWHRLLGPRLPYAVKSDLFVKLERRENADRLRTYGVVPSRAIDVALDLGARASDPATLARIEAPVLVLHARGDEAADPQASRRALEAMTRAASRRYIAYERSNHILLLDYEAEPAMVEIERFLDG